MPRRNERAHQYERPYLHDLSAHDRQAEPVALCESVAGLVCTLASARDLLDRPAGRGADDLRLILDTFNAGLRLVAMLRYVLSDATEVLKFCEDSWITEAEITTGMLMVAVEQRS
jgi:hypothetical protein